MPNIFDHLGNIVDSLDGQTDAKNLQAQLAQQAQLNAQLLELQKEQLAAKQTPEYQRTQRIKIFVAAAVFICALGAALYLLKYGKE